MTPLGARIETPAMLRFFTKRKDESAAAVRNVCNEVAERQRIREERHQWAIEQANFTVQDEGADEVLRVARRFYREAFNEEWDD